METVYEVAEKFQISDKEVVQIIREQQAKQKIETTTGNNTLSKSSSSDKKGSGGSQNGHQNESWGMNNNPLYAAYCMLLDSKVLYENAPDFYHAEKKIDEDFKNPADVKLLATPSIHPERIIGVIDYTLGCLESPIFYLSSIETICTMPTVIHRVPFLLF